MKSAAFCLIACLFSSSAAAETLIVEISTAHNNSAELRIAKGSSNLVASGTWSADKDAELFGIPGGNVVITSGNMYLQGSDGVAGIELTGFTWGSRVGDHGAGEKLNDDGSFPSGSLNWEFVEHR